MFVERGIVELVLGIRVVVVWLEGLGEGGCWDFSVFVFFFRVDVCIYGVKIVGEIVGIIVWIKVAVSNCGYFFFIVI